MSRELRLLLWLFLVHCVGIYLFTKGFLLSRLSLSDRSSCTNDTCTSLATHKRAVLLVIDALRFDFISAHPPDPPSPYHHNILTLPRELTAAHPDHSFIFNAYADPPTTTLQRIKGLTTGSLPTFVDVGDSFGGSAIHEDSLIHQLNAAGRKVALAGDNTWTTLFPDFLAHNMSFPFDSFNVEDLHTVDEGVIHHLLPLVERHAQDWGLAIAHGLGVDHAGHRVGPDHPVMQAKLQQMNNFLADVVSALDEDTLLVLLGDHGMDRTGNHGGDSILETMSAVWIYSKGPPLSLGSATLPESILPTTVFPGETVPQRSIQQIDLVPTLSLLLGLPIPFNNLGSVVPEVFNRAGWGVREALELNARQIKRYLDTYRASPSGSELDGAWLELSNGWSAAQNRGYDDAITALSDFNRLALSTCRTLWAQFSLALIGAGLVVIASSIGAAYCVYTFLGEAGEQWEEILDRWLASSLRAGLGGLTLGGIVYIPLRRFLDGVYLHHAVLFGGALASTLTLVYTARPSLSRRLFTFTPIILILHTLCFASNSYTIWEDPIVLFLLLTSLVPSVLTGLTAPTPRLRSRILGFSALFAVCVRLMALSTVCREEQNPWCAVTFYTSPTSSAPPVLALVLAPLGALAVPYIIRRVLGTSKSDRGLAAVWIPWVLSPALSAGTAFWVMEWAQATGYFGEGGGAFLREVRTGIAWVTVGMMVLGSVALWWASPVCLEVNTEVRAGDGEKEVTVLGFANAFGSPYLVFWTIFLSTVWLCTQLTGQTVLGLSTIALLAHLEIVDSVRDAHALNDAFSRNPTTALDLNALRRELSFSEIIPLALLATHTFHGTGHQPTIPSLQWKSAFILTSTVSFPSSHLSVIANTLGPHFLLGLGAPLLALWNLPPLPILPHTRGAAVLRAALGAGLYFAVVGLASAGCAAGFRRHLMVWKVWAPRWVFAALEVGAVDLGVVVGVGLGFGRVREKVGRVFEGVGRG
ncbi:hypothetical protein HYDPIDRAFT_102314 [Hydnomerulius pinastri MD-312]|uniref:Uncharacterized protein n=1 Tax=Hydnomerulius pinastri MD-312 TaxID=994086 RepID=A0A0C9VYX1_9AGAM|nr:hypothetical protein HYDPIDRAFT_102314 [Hydnomerulius pinastri MD-312]